MTIAIARHPLKGQCLAPGRAAEVGVHTGGYSRLFPDLAPLVTDPALLHALGRRGAACDAGDDSDAEVCLSRTAAGWPHFGQLVAHDITADRSPLDHPPDAPLDNFRTPRLILECLYGAGPVGSPYLYDREDGASLLLGLGGHDVPRNAQGTALLGDPRNDVHLFVNQLHLALLKAHNAIVATLRAEGEREDTLFDSARRTLVWHYQWVVVHDFLAGLVGAETVAALLDAAPGDRLARGPTIPYEFADAAYRYGHAQIRQRYRINADLGELAMFPDLIGFCPVGPERAVDWSLFFDMPGRPPAQRAGRIDGRLPPALIALPHAVTGDVLDPDYASLAARDLQRGAATALPSGEAVAHLLGVAPLTRDQVALPGWKGETPLYLYIMREAEVLHDGDRLGPVGGRIVADVLVAILDGDAGSFRAQPGWVPVLPASASRPEGFGLVDLLLLPDRPPEPATRCQRRSVP